MSTEQLNRMESLLTQLVSTVGRINTELQVLKNEQHALREELKADQQALREELKADQQTLRDEFNTSHHELKSQLKAFRLENETRHHEVMQKFQTIEADLDYIWEKTSRNERDIAKLKK